MLTSLICKFLNTIDIEMMNSVVGIYYLYNPFSPRLLNVIRIQEVMVVVIK